MKQPRNFNRGFTLIELLVVVAIIAILATTILAALGTARAKARLARAQSEVSSMRAAAELTTGTDGGYPQNLFDDTVSNMATLVEDVSTNYDETLGSNGGSWAFSFAYPGGTGHFCADSSGFAGESSGPANDTSISGVWSCPQ